MLRRRTIGSKKLVFFQKRFYPAGNYTWTVPPGCTEVDVFLVGGGGGGNEKYGKAGVSDYTEGKGSGVNGGGGGSRGDGGDGTVLIRYWAYEE